VTLPFSGAGLLSLLRLMAPKRKKSNRRRNLSLILAVAMFMAVIFMMSNHSQEEAQRPQPTALIYDPLINNPASTGFTGACSKLLATSGFRVEVVSGRPVTVESIRSPRPASLVIYRVHSSVFEGGVWFFTGEPYSNSVYVLEQLANEVHIGRTSRDANYTFAVEARFVQRYMKGRLNGAVVVLMGCDGLAAQDLTEAFIGAGAIAYVSWDGPVTLPHTDAATLAFVEGLAGLGMNVEDAIHYAEEKVGPAIPYNSYMVFYPKEVSGLKLNQ
jgi:hypothetical protein